MELEKNPTTSAPRLISRIELGKQLGICPRVISKTPLPFVVLGKRKYYSLDRVLKHLDAK